MAQTSPDPADRTTANSRTPPAPSAPLTVVARGVRRDYRVWRSEKKRGQARWQRMTTRRPVSISAVRGIDLDVQAGEFVGVIGRNGSGKSTLLRLLAGVEAPSSGTVLTSGRPSLLGVSAALIPDLTGAENIRLGALAMGMSPEESEEIFDDVVELSGLEDSVHLPMRTYSSGMGSRLKFAISVAAQPEILMIDEALATGDASFAERAQEAANGLLKRSGTVFMVNHAAETIENMCTRAIWLERGKMVLDGDAVEVARKYRWFAHNLAQGEESKAEGLLQDAMDEGREQRQGVSDTEVTPSSPPPDPSLIEMPGYRPRHQSMRAPTAGTEDTVKRTVELPPPPVEARQGN